jgi:hypothetical protein
VRVSPKSIFFGLVVLGLPIAVTIGWTMATPAPRPASVELPVGTGGIGAAAGNDGVGGAPERRARRTTTTTVPVTPNPARSEQAPLPSVPAPSVAASATTDPPESSGSPSTLPTLDEPPVPTPTEITVLPSGWESEPPPSEPLWPSPEPSASS